MALVDTHVHLADTPLAGDLPGVLSRARAAGIAAFVVPSGDEASSRSARDLARLHPGEVFAAAGLHPWEVGAGGLPDLRWLEAMLAEGGFVAVGETGLDGVVAGADLDAQERVFRIQAGLAREAGLPLIVHVRGAFDRTARVLESLGPGGPGGVLHAFGGSAEVATRLRRLGFLRGVGGAATRPEAVNVRKAVAATPLDAMVLETDAPYIGTRLRPKGSVEPAAVAEVRDAVAILLGVAPDEVGARTSATARGLFRLPGIRNPSSCVPGPASSTR